ACSQQLAEGPQEQQRRLRRSDDTNRPAMQSGRRRWLSRQRPRVWPVTVGRRANLVLRPNADCRFRLCCLARPLAAGAPLKNPITGIAGCCARAARGHPAAAPRGVTKRRRVAVGTYVSSHAPRPHPYVRLSRITLLARVGNGPTTRIRASAFDTRPWLRVKYVLCWCVFPLAPALRSTDTAATAPADASAGGFLRFVRRLHRYYDEVRLLVSVHHRLRLLAFPMRTAVLIQQVTTAARHEISQVPIRSLCT